MRIYKIRGIEQKNLVQYHIVVIEKQSNPDQKLKTAELVTLIKKKAGLTMQDKSNDPKEKAIPIFKLNGDDVILKWQVECKYIKE